MIQTPENIVSILERITDAFVALDNNWCYTYMNKKAGEIFNRDPKTIIGKHIWAEFPEGMGQPFYNAYYRAMAEQKYIYLEEYYPPYNKWFENHIYPSPEGLSIYFRDITKKKKREEVLKEKINFIESIINSSPDIIYIYDIEQRKNVYINEGIQLNLAYTDVEIKQMGDQVLTMLMHPEDFDYYLHNTYLKYSFLKDKEIIAHEFRMKDKTGNWHWLHSKESIFLRKPDGSPKQIFGVATDVTERKKKDLILDGEKTVMEMIATGKPMKEILNTIALNYESNANNAICSILLLDEEGIHLRHGAGPNLPDDYNDAIDGVAIGNGVGSCGTAAFTGEPVIVADIANDLLWIDYRDLALSFGLKACWSTPIINNNNKVLGTFAIYYKQIQAPSVEDFTFIERTANQVKIALERHKYEFHLKQSEEKYRLLIEQATDGIIQINDEGKIILVNNSYCQMLGYSAEELLNLYMIDTFPEIEKELFKQRLEQVKKSGAITFERTMLRKDGAMFPVETLLGMTTQGRYQAIVRDITERKKAEERIKANEEQYRDLVENITDLICTHDLDGKILSVNPAAEKIMGRRFNQQDNFNIKDILSSETINKYQDYIDDIKKNGRSQGVMKVKTSGGEIRIWEFNNSLKTTGVNTPPIVRGYARDITERKIAERELQISEERFRRVVEHIHDALIIDDIQGRIVYANDKFYQLFGFSNTEFISLQLEDYIAPEYLEQLRDRHMRRILGEPEPTHFEYEGIRKDGKRLWLEVDVTEIRGEHGSITGTQTALRDITERKKAEEEIKISEFKYRTLIEQASEAICIADASFHFSEVNISACNMFGYSRKEFLRLSVKDLLDEEDIQSNPLKLQDLKEGKTVRNERKLKRKDGTLMEAEVSGKMLEDGRFILFGRDITERKKTEGAIKNSAKQLRQLATHLQTIREVERKRIAREIHDELGQQLTAIKMDVAWIDKKTPRDAEDVKEKLKNIITLLDGSNPSIRKILSELRPGILDNYDLLEALEWQGRQFTNSTGIPVILSSPETEIRLSENMTTCIFRVYQEALTNIMRYAQAKNVFVSLRIMQDTVIVSIRDDGKGFETTSLKNKKSFGILGMKERVLSLQGKFELVSAKGKGTSITISLPYKELTNTQTNP